MEENDRQFLTPEQVRAQLRQISDVEWYRIDRRANYYAQKLQGMEGQDLKNEAIRKILSLEKTRRADVLIFFQILQTIKQIWFDQHRQQEKQPSIVAVDEKTELTEIFIHQKSGIRQEKQVFVNELYRRCLDKLEKDPVGKRILTLRVQGFKGIEIADEVGLSGEEFDSKCRNVRRICQSIGDEILQELVEIKKPKSSDKREMYSSGGVR